METILICLIIIIVLILFIKAPRLGEEHSDDRPAIWKEKVSRDNYAADGFFSPSQYPLALTDHARERMRERLHIHDGEQMEKYACDAYQYGKSARQLRADARYRIYQMQEEKGGIVLLYKGYVYIFSKENVLITVYKNESIYS